MRIIHAALGLTLLAGGCTNLPTATGGSTDIQEADAPGEGRTYFNGDRYDDRVAYAVYLGSVGSRAYRTDPTDTTDRNWTDPTYLPRRYREQIPGGYRYVYGPPVYSSGTYANQPNPGEASDGRQACVALVAQENDARRAQVVPLDQMSQGQRGTEQYRRMPLLDGAQITYNGRNNKFAAGTGYITVGLTPALGGPPAYYENIDGVNYPVPYYVPAYRYENKPTVYYYDCYGLAYRQMNTNYNYQSSLGADGDTENVLVSNTDQTGAPTDVAAATPACDPASDPTCISGTARAAADVHDRK